MPKLLVWKDDDGEHLLPYLEPTEVFKVGLTLHHAFDVSLPLPRYVVLEVSQRGKDERFYVACRGATLERVSVLLRWNGAGSVNFVILPAQYVLKPENEVEHE
jgi:hypothetical protein